MRKILAVPIVLGLGTLAMFVGALTQPANAATQAPTCNLQAGQTFNHVVFTTTWSGGTEGGEYPFVYDDGSPSLILTGTNGTRSFPHDYGYTPGGVVIYTPGFTVVADSQSTSCFYALTIDDTPGQPPSVDLTIDSQNLNRLVFRVIWAGGLTNHAHIMTFGDGNQTGVVGTSGNVTVLHDYLYAVGGVVTYTTQITVDGGSGSKAVDSVNVVIDDRPQPTPACTLNVAQNFNHTDSRVTWVGGTHAGVYPFAFGDGSFIDLLGPSGGVTLTHDYSYTVGGFTYYTQTVTITGPSGPPAMCLKRILIDDGVKTYLPIIGK